jgi:Bestrophin, RFP-TM, chloride channel
MQPTAAAVSASTEPRYRSHTQGTAPASNAVGGTHVVPQKPAAADVFGLGAQTSLRLRTRNVWRCALSSKELAGFLTFEHRHAPPEAEEGFSMSAHLDDESALFFVCIQRCPIVARRHTNRFLQLYLFFLPFALWQPLGWATVFVGPLLAMVLASIENVGARLQLVAHPSSLWLLPCHANVADAMPV